MVAIKDVTEKTIIYASVIGSLALLAWALPLLTWVAAN